MADRNNWFNSWLHAAKNKSTEVLEFVKKDLEEFGSVVKQEASTVVSTTGSAITKTLKLDESDSTAGSMKRSISSFLGQMNTILNPSPDDSDTEAIIINEDSDPVTLTKLQQEIYNLQKNETTFLDDPEDSLMMQFNCWLEIIEDQLSEERLNRHLNSSLTLKNQYEKLVPEKVSHILFWKRYLFKKAVIEDEMARKEAMEKREQKESMTTTENIKWEHEDFATDIELSEEEQIRLLEQYEAETKQKKNGSISPNKANETKVEKLQGKEDHFKLDTPLKWMPKSDGKNIKKTDSNCSLDLELKSTNSSSDGDWEKINSDEN
ncbi:BSD domain-containing protein 1-B isoform X2 [Agrilus planipennis]|uniref:BSD domain-containing protein 1-B isoform X2 n=1 Tax=Agrilus planipennis TaxID=224129 RepID=A0A1W4WYT3_AGRPL|nr:BSD domain-containing protein 1-B isoform X2 [Agrilus planipennis]